MGKRFIVSESEKNDIRRMYGFLLEQNDQPLVPPKVYEIIKQIESVYSYMDNGKIMGRRFNGNEIENDLSNYIDKTIGKNSWFQMDEKLRAQIYAYAFQSDSGAGGELKMKWIAGLANAINSGVNRAEIVRKPLDDPKVQSAIKIIQNACQNGTINSIYSKYLQILDEQYKSSDYNDNYKNIWKYRPQAIDRMMNGESYSVVLNAWSKYLSEPNSQSKQNAISIVSPSLSGFTNEIATKTSGVSLDLNSIRLDVDNKTFSVNLGNTPVYKIVLRYNMAGETKCISCENTINKNRDDYGAEELKGGTFENNTRIYSLIILYPKQ